MLKRTLFPVFGLLLLFLCTAFMSCNFSETKSSADVTFSLNAEKLLSRTSQTSEGDVSSAIGIKIALRGDYSDTKETVLSPDNPRVEMTFSDIPVGSSIKAVAVMTSDSQPVCLGFSETKVIQSGQNNISVKVVNLLNEDIMQNPFAYSQTESQDGTYMFFIFHTADSAEDSGYWLLTKGLYPLSCGSYNNLTRNEAGLVQSFSITEYAYKDSAGVCQIVQKILPQTITISEHKFSIKVADGITTELYYFDAAEIPSSGAGGTISLPITTGDLNIGFDTTNTSKNYYMNNYKFTLQLTDKEGNEITDDILWTAKLLYAGTDLNVDPDNPYYAFDAETASLIPVLDENGLNKCLGISGYYQLFVQASCNGDIVSNIFNIHIPDEYYYECEVDTELYSAMLTQLASVKNKAVIKLTGEGLETNGNDNGTMKALVSSLNCLSLELDFSELTGITSIVDSEFANKSSIASIRLPAGITQIGEDAFKSCNQLEDIQIPDGVTSLGKNVFYGCKKLSEVTLPSAITAIDEASFENCENLKKVIIPDGVTAIGVKAFYGCSLLSDITLPDGLTSIGDSAFYSCSSLKEIVFPSTLQSIGESAFYGCSSLTSIEIINNVSLGHRAFNNCKKLVTADLSGVTSFGSEVLAYCDALTTVKLSVELEEIPAYIFCNSGLTSFVVPSNIKRIGKNAFNSSNLSSITFNEGLIGIGEYAFERTKLVSVSFPDSLRVIGGSAFRYYDSSKATLASVTFGSGLVAIGPLAFASSKLTPPTTMSGTWGQFEQYGDYPWDEDKYETLSTGGNLSNVPSVDTPVNFTTYNFSDVTSSKWLYKISD